MYFKRKLDKYVIIFIIQIYVFNVSEKGKIKSVFVADILYKNKIFEKMKFNRYIIYIIFTTSFN